MGSSFLLLELIFDKGNSNRETQRKKDFNSSCGSHLGAGSQKQCTATGWEGFKEEVNRQREH